MFINLKGVERMDYISYITSFDQLYDVPRDRKGGEYRKYLAALLDYLWSFMTRTRPLLDLEVEMAEVLKDFDSKFERGELPGWAREQVIFVCVGKSRDVTFSSSGWSYGPFRSSS